MVDLNQFLYRPVGGSVLPVYTHTHWSELFCTISDFSAEMWVWGPGLTNSFADKYRSYKCCSAAEHEEIRASPSNRGPDKLPPVVLQSLRRRHARTRPTMISTWKRGNPSQQPPEPLHLPPHAGDSSQRMDTKVCLLSVELCASIDICST